MVRKAKTTEKAGSRVMDLSNEYQKVTSPNLN